MNKFERQGAILRLVGERQLSTQSDVVEALRDEGLDAVQATVSRDIAQLGLVKVRGERRPPRLRAPGRRATSTGSSELAAALRRWVVGLEPTGNLVVLRTPPGLRERAGPRSSTRSRCPRSPAASPATTRSSSPPARGTPRRSSPSSFATTWTETRRWLSRCPLARPARPLAHARPRLDRGRARRRARPRRRAEGEAAGARAAPAARRPHRRPPLSQALDADARLARGRVRAPRRDRDLPPGRPAAARARRVRRDTARVLSCYLDALAIRTHAHSEVDEFASAAAIPVVNALTDEAHPLQALADLQTIRERFGTLEGVRVAWVGDGNNVCLSLAEACALLDAELICASPPGYEPAERSIAVVDDPREAVRGAHVVVTDVWTSMGQEAERDERLAASPARRSTRRCSPSPIRTRSCSTACRRIPARRSPPTSSTAPAAPSGTRRRTACTRPRRCWR